MGCGYEAPIDGSTRWHHPGHVGDPPPVCVGYLAQLPDVVAVSRLRIHAGGGAPKSPRTRLLVEEMAIQSSAAELYSIRAPRKPQHPAVH